MRNWTFRPAAAGDAGTIARLSGVLGYPATEEEGARRLQPLLENPDHGVFVAADPDRVAGWVHVHRVHRIGADPFAEIGGLVVDAARRGEGIGRALLDAAENWATERGIHRLRVRSNLTRVGAHAIYEKTGCRQVKRQGGYEKEVKTR